MDVIFDTPVIVLPRTINSTEVFVAHLGKISINNDEKCPTRSQDPSEDNSPNHDVPKAMQWNNIISRKEYYNIEVKDMNIYSLDTANRRSGPLGLQQ